ncbi:hypothetical protein C8A05DRAFT_41535 [Staphylotrichum tortipilum]|uniref:GAT domain-containing protein n=1 Tax=Staphylotrichum tortipilum TaxID=2831512 RepID=A0AAN6MRH1_9PEZI|nr:hypothetical protein C8A05DRAFT_41535 [Staphylotrichum longicolle]
MGGFSMNKVLGSIKKRPTFGGSNGDSNGNTTNVSTGPPEAIADRCVGDDVIFLPSIVEAAVASPVAAAECAHLIRKFMSRDSKASCQYNAIMLIRILADNPGPGFTRHIDKKFIDASKQLLRNARDPSVSQILMETLETFESTKANDEGLVPIITMWRKEKEKAYRAYGGMPGGPIPRTMTAPPFNPQQPYPQSFYPQQQRHQQQRLPDPVELANRLEEARTSAKLLEQVVACTPPSEVLSNDLIKEFSGRCAAASRSVQGYMAAENPPPDNDTMESLIDTNEQLQQALNQHHRAVLQAKKHLGVETNSRSSTSIPSPPPSQAPPHGRGSGSGPPVPRKAVAGGSNGKGKATSSGSAYDPPAPPVVAGPSRSANNTPRHESDDTDDDGQDPFRDPTPAEGERYHPSSSSRFASGGGKGGGSPPRLSYEPFHPGFGGGNSGGAGGAGGAAGKMGEKTRVEPVTPVSDDEEDDVYRSTPRGKAAGVYRY